MALLAGKPQQLLELILGSYPPLPQSSCTKEKVKKKKGKTSSSPPVNPVNPLKMKRIFKAVSCCLNIPRAMQDKADCMSVG